MTIIKSSSIERKIKNLIPSFFKKLIVKILTISLFGFIIKLINPRTNFLGGSFDYKNVSNKEAAEIFYGFWESAEIRFSIKFAHCKTIVELGSSVGVTLGVLANKRSNTNFVCVEASPINFKKLLKLKKILPSNGNNYSFLNKALAYGSEYVAFKHVSTKGSKILENAIDKTSSYKVAAISLSDILYQHDVSDGYSLITDIEGAEANIFFEDSESLKNCHNIIAEIDNSSIASAKEQILKLKEIGFEVAEQYGRVYVLNRIKP